MKLRGFKTLLIAGLLIAASSSPALAQDGGSMSFGVDEAKAAPTGPSPVAGLLAQGKKLFASKNYLDAAKRFYAVTQSDSPAAQIDKMDAQYQLAKSLAHLKLYQSALSYYNDIAAAGETHYGYLPSIQNGIFDVADESVDDARIPDILFYYVDNFLSHPQNVPARYQNRFRYLASRSFLSKSGNLVTHNVSKPISLLKGVTPASPDYAKAQYSLGVAYANSTIENNASLAADCFKNTLRSLLNKGKDKLTKDEKRLLELGYIGLARVAYSIGASITDGTSANSSQSKANAKKYYEQAIKYYSRIDRRSENWPVALYESSWVYFRLNNFNKALGNLQSVTSPFFSDRYFPEAPILTAYIYYYNCRYDRVNAILDDFDYEYVPLLEDVKNLVQSFKRDYTTAFRWLISVHTSGASNKSLQRVVNYTLSNKQVREQLSYLVALTKELKSINELPDNFQQSSLGKNLIDTVNGDISSVKMDIGEKITTQLGRVAAQLAKYRLRSKEIRTQISKAESDNYNAELRSDEKIAANEIKADKIKTTSEQLVWDFDGEYWRDELGYYAVSIVSQCKR